MNEINEIAEHKKREKTCLVKFNVQMVKFSFIGYGINAIRYKFVSCFYFIEFNYVFEKKLENIVSTSMHLMHLKMELGILC